MIGRSTLAGDSSPHARVDAREVASAARARLVSNSTARGCCRLISICPMMGDCLPSANTIAEYSLKRRGGENNLLAVGGEEGGARGGRGGGRDQSLETGDEGWVRGGVGAGRGGRGGGGVRT